jgi:trimethylamine--corrinoid protein Co-methyltransferase
MLQMMAKTMRRPDVSNDEIDAGIAAIAEVPTGGHFFGSQHTLARYETAFYHPIVSDWQNYENWVEGGAETADVRATRVWQRTLEDYVQPELDPEITRRLDEFVARRRLELQDMDL